MNRKFLDVIVILMLLTFSIVIRFPIGKNEYSQPIQEEMMDGDVQYLHDADSYYYLRIASDYIENGDVKLSEVFKSKYGLPYLGYLVNKVTNIEINKIAYYLCALVTPLICIPVYLFMRKRVNMIAGIVSGIFVACAPSVISHTVPGYFDTDGLIILFSTTTIICFADCLMENDIKKQIVLGLVSVLSLHALACSWGAFYTSAIIFSAVALCSLILVLIIYQKHAVSLKSLIVPSAVTLINIIFMLTQQGGNIFNSVTGLYSTLIPSNVASWPSPSTYIAELKDYGFFNSNFMSNFASIYGNTVCKIGGLVVLITVSITLVTLTVMALRALKEQDTILDKKNIIMFFPVCLVWLLVTIVLTNYGNRFVMFMSIPISIIIGLGVGMLYIALKRVEVKPIICLIVSFILGLLVFASIYDVNQIVAFVALAICALLAIIFRNETVTLTLVCVSILASLVVGDNYIAKNSIPVVSKTLDDGLQYIKNNSNEDAKIASWWDHGYFFRYKSKRSVIADGGTYDGQMYYWLANALMTNNEELSIRIFNMLANSSLEIPAMVEEQLGSPKKCAEALKDILSVDPIRAYSRLTTTYGFTGDDSLFIINNCFKRNKEVYLVLTRDMLTIVNPISFYGLYNFEDNPTAILGHSAYSYANGDDFFLGDDLKIEILSINDMYVQYDIDDDRTEVEIVNGEGESYPIGRLIYIKDGEIQNDFEGVHGGYTVYLLNENGRFSTIVVSSSIDECMLVRLFLNVNYEKYQLEYTGIENKLISIDVSDIQTLMGTSNDAGLGTAGVRIYKLPD